MATIHLIAPEILNDIFKLAHDPHKPSTLCAAALVCRAWRDLAQRTLFLDIAIPIPRIHEEEEGVVDNLNIDMLRRWDAYKSTRLCPPHLVELWGRGRGGRVDDPEPVLDFIVGVKVLIVASLRIKMDFFGSPKLRELERLDFNTRNWNSHVPATLPQPASPLNLCSVRIHLLCFEELLRTYLAPTSLVSLTLVLPLLNHKWSVLSKLPDPAIIPSTVLDLSIVLTIPNQYFQFNQLLSFFTAVQNLRQVTFQFDRSSDPGVFRTGANPLLSLAGSLPTSIKRLCLTQVSNFNTIQLPHFYATFSEENLPNLKRIDSPDFKRKDLEDAAGATDLLAECERRSIRVVCWEEFL